jgi:hypothetical protein
MKNIDIELERINNRSQQIYDRLGEINGEKTTIQYKIDKGFIDFILGSLQIQALEYEAMLLLDEIPDLESGLAFIELADELNLDTQPL